MMGKKVAHGEMFHFFVKVQLSTPVVVEEEFRHLCASQPADAWTTGELEMLLENKNIYRTLAEQVLRVQRERS